jgi:carbonic anhydrase/acetyltransferase-like protein (isoleucine patch superfamily)
VPSLRLDPGLTRVDPSAFVARGAVVVGDVVVGADASVWFGAVLRGDVEQLVVGARANVQDGAIVHADPGFPARIGDDVTIGHRVVVHGATVGEGSLIGMGAILLNGAEIGPRTLVGAGALVPGGKRFPPGVLLLGSPVRVVRDLTEAELADLVASTTSYVEKGRAFRAAGWHDPAFGAPAGTPGRP